MSESVTQESHPDLFEISDDIVAPVTPDALAAIPRG